MSNHYQDENLRKVQQHLQKAGEGVLSWLDDNSTEEMKRAFYKDGAELAGFIVSTAQDLQDFLLNKLEELDGTTTAASEDPFQRLQEVKENTDSEFEKLIRNAMNQEDEASPDLNQFESDIEESHEETTRNFWGSITSEEDDKTPLDKAKELSTVFARAGLSSVTVRTGLNVYAVYVTLDNNARSILYVTDNTTARDIENAANEIIGLLRPNGLSDEERQSILDKMQKVLVKIRKENPRIRYSRKPRFTFPQGETYGLVYWYNRDNELVQHEIYLSTGDEEIDEIVEQYFIQA